MIKIKIKLHPNSSKEEIKKINENNFEVWVKEKPIDNKANIELIKILKKYFKRNIKIKSGLTSRNKIIEVLD